MQNLRHLCHDAHMHTRVCYKPKIPPVNVLIAGGTANLSFLVSMNRDFNPPPRLRILAGKRIILRLGDPYCPNVSEDLEDDFFP